jgi:hypothetical protein
VDKLAASCLSETSAARAASYAARPEREHCKRVGADYRHSMSQHRLAAWRGRTHGEDLDSRLRGNDGGGGGNDGKAPRTAAGRRSILVLLNAKASDTAQGTRTRIQFTSRRASASLTASAFGGMVAGPTLPAQCRASGSAPVMTVRVSFS